MQKILVFQQKKSGESKIAGIEKYGGNLFSIERVNIDCNLPIFIEDCAEFLPKRIEADLVLDYSKHPDLAAELAALCVKDNIPVISSRKKIKGENVFIPPTCCGLTHHKSLGEYGRLFGSPEFFLQIKKNIIQTIDVIRGAPCGATWDAIKKIVGLTYQEGCRQIGLQTQFFCTADPSSWDPLFGKSPVHFAGDIHRKALIKALKDEI